MPIAVTEEETPAAVELSERCRGDGAVQSWLLIPIDPPQSQLMAAYQERQVIEFQGTVIGQDDDPARLPHRRYTVKEAAEGVTLAMEYQGDSPPLVQNQSYRFVAWADLAPVSTQPITATQAPQTTPAAPESRGYELQVYDSAGLLFLGLTDVDLQDDPLAIEFANGDGECVPVAASSVACVDSRQVQPLRIRWGDAELTLYPGEDGQLRHAGAVYEVSLFRNRDLQLADPPCPDYYEHRRSLRLERIDPPPVLPTLPPITSTLTATITTTQPVTPAVPSPSP